RRAARGHRRDRRPRPDRADALRVRRRRRRPPDRRRLPQGAARARGVVRRRRRRARWGRRRDRGRGGGSGVGACPRARPPRRDGARVRRPAARCPGRGRPVPDPLRGGAPRGLLPPHAAGLPQGGGSAVTLSARRLNRALLARQLLLARVRIPLGRALERVGGLQAQYAPSPYIRLWSTIDGFSRDDLTRALERRRAVQGTLMRSTIHIVSPRDYWSFAAAVGPSRQEWWLTTWGRHESAANVDFAARELETALAGRAWQRTEIDALLPEKSATVWSGIWIPLVRVPPSGTWERRRADLFRLAAEWLPPEQVTEEEGLEHLLRRYLSAFGPSTLADAASWAGVKRATLLPAAERIPTRTFRDEDGRGLHDLPRAPLPPEDTRAPIRFLGHWDAALLVHARRTQ